MPAPRPSANPFRNPSIGDRARDGMLLTVRCNLCRRTANYWASDLVLVLGPRHQAHVPPFPCSRCRTRDYMSCKWDVPSATRIAEGLTVRRPVRQITRWLWRDEPAR